MTEFRRWRIAPSQLKLCYIEKWVLGKNILDVGCGLGFYSKYLYSKGFDVTAIDKEKQFKDEQFKFKIASATKLPFENKSFDTVLLFDVLEHTDDTNKVLKEIKRVTRKRVIMSVPNNDDTPLPYYNLTFKHNTDRTHIQFYTAKSISSQLKKHGFDIKTIQLENAVSPFVFSGLIRFRVLKIFFMAIAYAMKKLKLFNLPKADIYIVADV